MCDIFVLVEGQTELTIVNKILKPYWEGKNIKPIAIKVTTQPSWLSVTGKKHSGGVNTYFQVESDLLKLLDQSNITLVTTMLDFYKLPDSFPGYSTMPNSNCFEKVSHIESFWEQKIQNQKFLAYISLHEVEALLFSDVTKILKAFTVGKTPMNKQQNSLRRVYQQFPSPEEINTNDPPSKRLKSIFPTYDKLFHGELIATSIGVEKMMNECPHFKSWVEKIEEICGSFKADS
jgi:Domain of unknown function (DUF4276)